MKFGHNLPRIQVPEWAPAYLDYKGLKRLIKSASVQEGTEGEPDLAEFFYALDRNVEDVDDFYNQKQWEAHRRLTLIRNRYGDDDTQISTKVADKDELDELSGALAELRDLLRKLQWYGEVNRRGFVKITKKLDKKISESSAQKQYLATKVDTQPFAKDEQLVEDLRVVNKCLAAVSDAEDSADASSILSSTSASIKPTPSSSTLDLGDEVPALLDEAIRKDDALLLTQQLSSITSSTPTDSAAMLQHLFLHLLQRSISCRAKNCIENLLGRIESLHEEQDINNRNCIHRLVIAIGRPRGPTKTKASSPPATGAVVNGVAIRPGVGGINAPSTIPAPSYFIQHEVPNQAEEGSTLAPILHFLLRHLRPNQQTALWARDVHGRLPLHYAAQFGLVEACKTIISCIQSWEGQDVAKALQIIQSADKDGDTALHLAVYNGHAPAIRELLHAGTWLNVKITPMAEIDPTATPTASSKQVPVPALLLAAARWDFSVAVQLLLDAGFNPDYQNNEGETALYLAARSGHTKSTSVLLSHPSGRANTEVPEKMYHWTPVFIACVEGQLGIVEMLTAAGADVQKRDSSGWTPKEHAALRGHMAIVRYLAKLLGPAAVQIDGARTVSQESTHIGHGKSESSSAVIHESIKSFGHRYLRDQSMVLVSLGSLDSRKQIDVVELETSPLVGESDGLPLDTALSVVVSASGATGPPLVVDLPLEETMSTSPVAFQTIDPTKVKIYFDIVATAGSSKAAPLARGVAALASLRPSTGTGKMALIGDLSVPVMAATTLEVVGKVNFNFLIVTPFQHPNLTISQDQTYWKKMGQLHNPSTTVIGHRGLGKNLATRKSLQLGENTIQSFITAASLGATYIEFDVQLTKDHVPVIYHDYLVSETGIDAPVHALTLEQFLSITDATTPRDSRTPSPSRIAGGTTPLDPIARNVPTPPRKSNLSKPPIVPGSVDTAVTDDGEVVPSGPRRGRSQSLDANSAPPRDIAERIKHTRDFKLKGFKANSRGSFIQAPFTTLEEIFRKLPESVGFNIEMKYPGLFESEQQEMDAYAVELNSFVDTVLTKVYDLNRNRHIIFSSFNPNICMLLSLKQPSIPVMFLSDAGTTPFGDVRSSSLQAAIRFTNRWNLLGVVSAAEPLVECPRLVRVVKESGLVCVSYGALNNEPANVRLQVNEGIDAVIVDNVLAIRKGLTEDEGKSTSTSVATAATIAADAKTPTATTTVVPPASSAVSAVP